MHAPMCTCIRSIATAHRCEVTRVLIVHTLGNAHVLNQPGCTGSMTPAMTPAVSGDPSSDGHFLQGQGAISAGLAGPMEDRNWGYA